MAREKLTRRERGLLSVLPAALILVVYSFLIALPKQRLIQVRATELMSTRSTAVDEQVAELSRESLQRTKTSLDRLRERIATDRLRIKELSQSWRNPEARLKTVQEITEMMGQFNLSIVSQDYELEPDIPEYFRQITQGINQQSPGTPPIEYWKIELEGAYTDVQEFLAAIDIDRMKTFALTISMVASDSKDSLHKWTILFAV